MTDSEARSCILLLTSTDRRSFVRPTSLCTTLIYLIYSAPKVCSLRTAVVAITLDLVSVNCLVYFGDLDVR